MKRIKWLMYEAHFESAHLARSFYLDRLIANAEGGHMRRGPREHNSIICVNNLRNVIVRAFTGFGNPHSALVIHIVEHKLWPWSLNDIVIREPSRLELSIRRRKFRLLR